MSAELGKARLVQGDVGASDLEEMRFCADGRFGDGGFRGLCLLRCRRQAAHGDADAMMGVLGRCRHWDDGRGGANPHVVQARPGVVPQVGIG
ncbi:hypothetical protein ABLN97_13415 [Mycobacterium tuberculosis]